MEEKIKELEQRISVLETQISLLGENTPPSIISTTATGDHVVFNGDVLAENISCETCKFSTKYGACTVGVLCCAYGEWKSKK